MKLVRFNDNFNSESHLFFKHQDEFDAFFEVLDLAFNRVSYIMIYDGGFPLDEVDRDYRELLEIVDMDKERYFDVREYMSTDYHLESLLESCFEHLTEEEADRLLPPLGYEI